MILSSGGGGHFRCRLSSRVSCGLASTLCTMGSCLSAGSVGDTPTRESSAERDTQERDADQHKICNDYMRHLHCCYLYERDRNLLLECSNRDLIVLLGKYAAERESKEVGCATSEQPKRQYTMGQTSEDGYTYMSLQ